MNSVFYQKVASTLVPRSEIVLPDTSSAYASVLVPLISIDGQWHILLTMRATSLRHHAGEVAFPGGLWEEGDRTPVDTALREAEEEISLSKDKVCVLGGLDEMSTRFMDKVRPVVGVVDSSAQLDANRDEIGSIFTVPIDFFIADKRLRTDIFMKTLGGEPVEHWIPAYQYGQYEIWGFTAGVILQLINRCFSAGISRENPAGEKQWF